ncbi:hypothetical protein A3Q56_05653 [Intoshia linei]|uniref:Uncharacterized protein n=1 Tax=Intoshia linei TaxID=1819745 RepID=A0A177AX90_9BILA|nr:hypothetical protein A3Q56_05653 [Intoshia linei]
MDDSHAMETSVNTVLSENTGAYMMFYRKIQNFKNHKTSNVPKSFLLPRVIEINKPQSQSTLNSATDNRKRKNERISKPTEHKPYFKESYKIKYPQKTKIDKLAFSYTMKAPKNCHNSNESSKLLEYLDCKDYDSLKEKPSSELTKDIFLQKNRKKMKFQFKTKNVFQKHYDKKFNSTN